IPVYQREAFVAAVRQLNASRGNGHSIIISCRPGSSSKSFLNSLSRVFVTTSGFAQWIILPLDTERMDRLLDSYGAEPWLKALIAGNERLRWLLRHPGTLADFVRATRGLHLLSPPQNLVQLYQLFVDGYLFGGVEPLPRNGSDEGRLHYHY